MLYESGWCGMAPQRGSRDLGSEKVARGVTLVVTDNVNVIIVPRNGGRLTRKIPFLPSRVVCGLAVVRGCLVSASRGFKVQTIAGFPLLKNCLSTCDSPMVSTSPFFLPPPSLTPIALLSLYFITSFHVSWIARSKSPCADLLPTLRAPAHIHCVTRVTT
jgi:hypothetical protein